LKTKNVPKICFAAYWVNTITRKCQQHPHLHLQTTWVQLPIPLHHRHWNSLSFCLRNFLSQLQVIVWTEAALVLLFKARSSSTWMSYVPHHKRKMHCLSGENIKHRIHWCWCHSQRTCCLPKHLRLMSSESSLSVAGWQQGGETARQGIWSCECTWKWTMDFCNCDSILNIYADVIVHICELELMLIMNVKTKIKIENENYLKTETKTKLELFTKLK